MWIAERGFVGYLETTGSPETTSFALCVIAILAGNGSMAETISAPFLVSFPTARILQGTRLVNVDSFVLIEQENKEETVAEIRNPTEEGIWPINEHEYLQEIQDVKAKYSDEIDKETSIQDGEASCLATCSTGDLEDDPFKSSRSCELAEGGVEDTMTSCVGTRWFRAPELLYGSTNYGQEVDLWSLGCIFAELLSLEPLFPGTSDIDQIGRIISVMGDFNEETAPGCSKLPDYNKISFNKVESPIGLESRLPDHSASKVVLVQKLIRYDPATRATAAELLGDMYFKEEPVPLPLNELKVPESRDVQDEKSSGEWGGYREVGSDSDFDDFGGVNVTNTGKGFSIRFS